MVGPCKGFTMKDGKYQITARLGKMFVYLGTYTTPEEAHFAHDWFVCEFQTKGRVFTRGYVHRGDVFPPTMSNKVRANLAALRTERVQLMASRIGEPELAARKRKRRGKQMASKRSHAKLEARKQKRRVPSMAKTANVGENKMAVGQAKRSTTDDGTTGSALADVTTANDAVEAEIVARVAMEGLNSSAGEQGDGHEAATPFDAAASRTKDDIIASCSLENLLSDGSYWQTLNPEHPLFANLALYL